VVDDSANLVKLIKNPNKYAVMIAGVVLIVILLVVLLIRLVLKLVKYQTGKRRSGSKAGE
jgi:type IV secretory pathway component VirB8